MKEGRTVLIAVTASIVDESALAAQFEARPANFKPDAENSLALTHLWLSTLAEFGAGERSVTADTPFYAVFSKNGKRTHITWNGSNTPREVNFSDGVRVTCAPRAFATH